MARLYTYHTGATLHLHDGGEHEFKLTFGFHYTPGEPERGPSYASGGEPACPAEVEIVSIVVTPSHHDGLATVILKIARDDETLLACMAETAAEDDRADRDAARELAAEDRRIGL